MLISFKNNKKTHSFYYVYSMDLLAIIGMETYRHGPPTRLSIQVIGSGYQSYTWNVKLEVIDLMVIHYLLHLIPCICITMQVGVLHTRSNVYEV